MIKTRKNKIWAFILTLAILVTMNNSLSSFADEKSGVTDPRFEMGKELSEGGAVEF